MATFDHAVVIGGSMAGLLTARVLSEQFAQVTVVERDEFTDTPEPRKGQPHIHHIHGLLASGTQLLHQLFPGLLDELTAEGAFVGDMGESMRWYCYGGYRIPITYGMKGITMSRPFLEWRVRRRVAGLPNVTLRGGRAAVGLEATADCARVTGVRLADEDGGEERLQADLVVDASGRGSASPRWLAAIGYQPPPESQVRINLGYATRILWRAPDDPLGHRWIMVTPEAPREQRTGLAFPIERGRWIVTLGGWYGDHPPTDELGFLAFARSLPAPDIADLLVQCAPLSGIRTYKFAANLRRHYERVNRFPEGYLVLGDAFCSFNPIYGQGMTSAAMQARTLAELLAEQRASGLEGLARAFFQRAAKVIDIPWQLAVGEDFRWPQAEGPRPAGVDMVNRYVELIHRASHHDPVVCQAFLDVMNLLQPLASLFSPPILSRAIRYGQEARVA